VKQGGTGDLHIPEANKSNRVMNFKGTKNVETDSDWTLLKSAWTNSLKAEASSSGYQLSEQVGQPSASSSNGVLVVVNVSDFRYLSTGARYAAGVMVGNAWVNSKVDFLDLKSGQVIGARTYDTKSTAWEGVLSAMTEKQVQAISRQIIADIKAAKAE
jgi:hypothetical protein